jgi:chromosome segregation ATPase
VVDIFEVPSADPVAIGLQLQQQMQHIQQTLIQQIETLTNEKKMLEKRLTELPEMRYEVGRLLNEYDSKLTQRMVQLETERRQLQDEQQQLRQQVETVTNNNNRLAKQVEELENQLRQ